MEATSNSVIPVPPAYFDNFKEKAIIVGKVAIVAAVSFALLAAAFAIIYATMPFVLTAASLWVFVGGISLLGFAIGLGGSGVGVPLYGQEAMCPMYEKTDHNLKDIATYLGCSLGTGLTAGAVGAVLAPIVITLFALGILFSRSNRHPPIQDIIH